ncbi:hypothetical protein K3495_g5201 [Podosphaera aphanis]|nr:hypothetical protein K3495_g5201 [Podosphaera aphanis]
MIVSDERDEYSRALDPLFQGLFFDTEDLKPVILASYLHGDATFKEGTDVDSMVSL